MGISETIEQMRVQYLWVKLSKSNNFLSKYLLGHEDQYQKCEPALEGWILQFQTSVRGNFICISVTLYVSMHNTHARACKYIGDYVCASL